VPAPGCFRRHRRSPLPRRSSRSRPCVNIVKSVNTRMASNIQTLVLDSETQNKYNILEHLLRSKFHHELEYQLIYTNTKFLVLIFWFLYPSS
jgi:hypothetical protein